MEGKAFLNTARKLVQMRDEAALRSAVSRAYYAAYNCCIHLARQLGFHFGNAAATHERIYLYLRNSGIEEAQAMAVDLKELRKRRNEADYDMSSTKFQNHVECQWDLVHAQSIISQIEKYQHEPLRTQLAAGLRDYEIKLKP